MQLARKNQTLLFPDTEIVLMEILYGEDTFISCRNNASIKDTSVFFITFWKTFLTE